MIIVPNQPSPQKEEKPLLKPDKSERPSQPQIALKPSHAELPITQTKLDLELDNFSRRLLEALKTGVSGEYKSPALNTLNASQIAPNLAREISTLILMLRSYPELSRFSSQLESLIKPIANISFNELKTAFKDSGVLLEAKLASISSATLPPSIKELLSLMKTTASPQLQAAFSVLAANETSDTAQSFNELFKLLSATKQNALNTINASNYQPLIKAADSFENLAKFLHKLSFTAQKLNSEANTANSVATTPNPSSLNHPALRALATLKTTLSSLSATLPTINLNNPSLINAHRVATSLTSTLNEISALTNTAMPRAPEPKLVLALTKASNSLLAPTATKLLEALSNQPQNSVATAKILSDFAAQITDDKIPQNAALSSSLNELAKLINEPKIASATIAVLSQNAKAAISNATPQPASPHAISAALGALMASTDTKLSYAAEALLAAINPSEQSQNADLAAAIIQSSPANAISVATSAPATLQEKLSLAARQLNNLINLLDSAASIARSELNAARHLASAAHKATADLPLISEPNEAANAVSLQNDIKAALLNIRDATTNNQNLAHIHQNSTRLITQIEMHQLASFAQNSLQTYLPFSWDGLESSSLTFKQGKKNRFYAKIELNFAKHGQINIVMGLSDKKYLDISILTARPAFKELILKHSSELKSAITKLGLIISGFSLGILPQRPYSPTEAADMGFSIKA